MIPPLDPSLQLVTQEILYKQLSALFPTSKIHQNVKKTTNVRYPATGSYMEFDIWIPNLRLCFEFQDVYHYSTAWYFHNTQGYINQKDSVKSEMARQLGFFFIEVPYWWDGSKQELEQTIYFSRPDLFPQTYSACAPTTLNVPLKYYFQASLIPNVGSLTHASFPSSTSIIKQGVWWLGEKYDGIRCCWVPHKRTLYTRHANVIPLLDSFTKLMPNMTLDNELWLGRGQYSMFVFSGSSLVSLQWPELRIVAFDSPALDNLEVKYEDRFTRLVRFIDRGHPFMQLALRMFCKLKKIGLFAQYVIDNGGEGLILQKHGSQYEQGRSQAVLKIKTAQADQEGIVTKIWQNKAVSLKLPQGATLTVPPEDVLISNKLVVGDIVSFSFDANSRRDAPLNPKIFRIRNDVSWEDVVRNFSKTKITGVFTTKPKGYWTFKNMRAYMENFAKRRNLDPLLPRTWLHSFGEFMKSKGSTTILKKFKSGYLQALQQLFPEVTFDPLAFKKEYYKIENRRKFFEDFANSNDFDPLVPENWYSEETNNVMSVQGALTVLAYHDQNIAKALLDLFPNIGLERTKLRFIVPCFPPLVRGLPARPLPRTPSVRPLKKIILPPSRRRFYERANLVKYDLPSTWNTSAKRRIFFERYAKSAGFDPLVPENWYAQSKEKIKEAKGAHLVLLHHQGLVARALIDLFPEVEFDISKLRPRSWENPTRRRKFFEKYAQDNGFDPLKAENWYMQSKLKIRFEKQAEMLLRYHSNNVSKALVDLFPEIGLDIKRLQNTTKTSKVRRRQVFVQFAEQRGFNPLKPENWYQQPSANFYSIEKIRKVLSYHSHSIKKALVDLFPNMGWDKSRLGHLTQKMFFKQEPCRYL